MTSQTIGISSSMAVRTLNLTFVFTYQTLWHHIPQWINILTENRICLFLFLKPRNLVGAYRYSKVICPYYLPSRIPSRSQSHGFYQQSKNGFLQTSAGIRILLLSSAFTYNMQPVRILNTVCLESRCALRLRYVDLVVSIKVAVELHLMS
jgi:hypothetical protein